MRLIIRLLVMLSLGLSACQNSETSQAPETPSSADGQAQVGVNLNLKPDFKNSTGLFDDRITDSTKRFSESLTERCIKGESVEKLLVELKGFPCTRARMASVYDPSGMAAKSCSGIEDIRLFGNCALAGSFANHLLRHNKSPLLTEQEWADAEESLKSRTGSIIIAAILSCAAKGKAMVNSCISSRVSEVLDVDDADRKLCENAYSEHQALFKCLGEASLTSFYQDRVENM